MSPSFRPMLETDLDAIMEVERLIYAFPWSRGNFEDSLKSGYHCKVMETDEGMIGYGLTMKILDEAHLLNLSVRLEMQGMGYGRTLLEHFIAEEKLGGARYMYLEVRPSNEIACALYRKMGFNEIAVRRKYYPAKGGREDALIMGAEI